MKNIRKLKYYPPVSYFIISLIALADFISNGGAMAFGVDRFMTEEAGVHAKWRYAFPIFASAMICYMLSMTAIPPSWQKVKPIPKNTLDELIPDQVEAQFIDRSRCEVYISKTLKTLLILNAIMNLVLTSCLGSDQFSKIFKDESGAVSLFIKISTSVAVIIIFINFNLAIILKNSAFLFDSFRSRGVNGSVSHSRRIIVFWEAVFVSVFGLISVGSYAFFIAENSFSTIMPTQESEDSKVISVFVSIMTIVQMFFSRCLSIYKKMLSPDKIGENKTLTVKANILTGLGGVFYLISFAILRYSAASYSFQKMGAGNDIGWKMFFALSAASATYMEYAFSFLIMRKNAYEFFGKKIRNLVVSREGLDQHLLPVHDSGLSLAQASRS